MDLSLSFAIKLMKWGSRHPVFGRPEVYYTAGYAKPEENEISPATLREFEDGARFFLPFEGTLRVQDLAGKDVLDLGCGYGGRTAYYLLKGEPRSIVGIETSEEKVKIAEASARKLCDGKQINFKVGFGESLPFEDERFDLILSYDVFEHVLDLPVVLGECLRVLRPGGRLCALFPPYYGPRSHHLDFITTLPFLHHLFSPSVLVEAANRILTERPEIKIRPLPVPQRSYLGREVLPYLNGTTEREFRSIVNQFHLDSAQVKLLPFAWGPGGTAKNIVREFCRIMLSIPWPFTRDTFVSTIRCDLIKPVQN
jgi:SAM-dependent methyltransferase